VEQTIVTAALVAKQRRDVEQGSLESLLGNNAS
jgi:hypothetical protein